MTSDACDKYSDLHIVVGHSNAQSTCIEFKLYLVSSQTT